MLDGFIQRCDQHTKQPKDRHITVHIEENGGTFRNERMKLIFRPAHQAWKKSSLVEPLP